MSSIGIGEQLPGPAGGTSGGGGGGSGTVTSVSVVTANGLAGSVTAPTTSASITLSTTVTGILKGNGTTISAAAAGTDYLTPSGNGSALTGITVGQVTGAQAGPLTGDVTTSGAAATLVGTANVESIITANTTVAGALQKANNLSDVTQRGTSRFNLRLPALASCQAAATANVNIAAPGASMDGYSFTTSGSDSFLLTGQSTPSQNGIWTWNGAASPATRQTDFPAGGSITGGRFVQVQNGTVNAGTLWILAVPSNAPITIDTTAQTWTALNITGTAANESIIRANSLNQLATATGSYSMGSNALTNVSTINKVTITTPATGSTLTIADGKTATVNNTLTLAGTDSTTMTFPSTSQTIAGLAVVAQTFTAPNVFDVSASTTGTIPLSLIAPTSSSADQTAASFTGASTGFGVNFAVANTAAAGTTNKSSFLLQNKTSFGQRTCFQFTSSFSNTTDASRTSLTTISGANAGAFVTVLTISGIDITFVGNLTMADAKNLVIGTTTGTQIGTGTTQKIGFYGVTPVVQPATTGGTTVTTAGATNTVFRNTTFPGASGATAYTVGDIVTNLKALGLLAA